MNNESFSSYMYVDNNRHTVNYIPTSATATAAHWWIICICGHLCLPKIHAGKVVS